MGSSKIIITAGLQRIDSVNTISDDLKIVANDLNNQRALEIVCHLDENNSYIQLNNELKALSDKLQINPTIKLDIAKNASATNIMSDIEKGADKVTQVVDKATSSLRNLEKEYTKSLTIKTNEAGYTDANATIKALHNRLSPLGKVSVKGLYDDTQGSVDSVGGSQVLKGMIATIRNARGEVRTLTYEIDNMTARLKSSSYDDKGVSANLTAIQKNVNSITKEYNKLKGEVGNFNTGIFAEIEKDGEKTVVTFESLEEHIKGLANGTISIEQVNAEMTALKGTVNSLDATLGQSQGKGFNRFQNAEIGAREFDSTIKQLELDISALDNSNPKVAELSKSLSALKTSIKNLQEADNRDNKWLEDYSEANIQIRDLRNNISSVAKELKQEFKVGSSIETLTNRIQKTSAAFEDWGNKNKKAISSNKQMTGSLLSFSETWQDLSTRLDVFKEKISKGLLTTEDIDKFKHLNEEIATFKKEADSANLTASSFFRNMRTQLSYVLMQWISLQGAIRIVKSMVSEIQDLDAAMINLKKVTDETDETYDRFISSAQKQAADLHTTTTAVVEQTAEWAKLGFTLEEAQQLSKNSAIYAMVGEVDNATAVSDLVTVLKAFNQTADETIDTVDKLNKLGNEFATDAKSLGEGLSVSASALSMAGNDLNQTLALITGGTEITQNARETGNAIKVISLRIRGMKGALEELNEETEGLESISKIQTQILNLTQNRVNIFDDNGDFKSTYEILKQISEIYDTLTSTQQASLTEILFGKVRANQGLAIIQAFQSGQIESAYEAAVGAAGSAQAEFDRMSEGIQAHINDFKQAFETLSNTVINSDLVKFVIDSGTTILNLLNTLIDKLGTLPTILTGLAAFGGIKGVGKLNPNMPIYAPLRLCA